MTDMQTDWRYSDERMDVRTQGLNILLNKFGSEICSDGSPRYSNQSIYECVHDWVSQGNVRTDGIVAYYKAYYDPTKRPNQTSKESTQRSAEETWIVLRV